MNTWKLDDDAIGPLLLNNRFGHTQFVDAIVQRSNVLAPRGGLYLGDGGLSQAAGKRVGVLAGCAAGECHVGQCAPQFSLCGIALVGRTECGHDRHFAAFHTIIGDARVAQLRANIGSQRVVACCQRTLHVNFQQEVHAAAKIEAQIHGVRANGREPVGRSRQQVQGHGIRGVFRVGVQILFDEIFGLQLKVG